MRQVTIRNLTVNEPLTLHQLLGSVSATPVVVSVPSLNGETDSASSFLFTPHASTAG